MSGGVSPGEIGSTSEISGERQVSAPGSRQIGHSPHRVHVVAINRWWENEPEERFWLEVTDRSYLGADLRAPQTGVSGNETATYSLVTEVGDDDIVFHYRLDERAITSWSRAEGGWWEDEILWAAHGTVSRDTTPFRRAAYYHGLTGPFQLSRPLTLLEIRDAEDIVRQVVEDLQTQHDGALYVPFQLRRDQLRMGQGYLFKLPAAFVRSFDQLAGVNAEVEPRRRRPTPDLAPPRRGYRRADEDAAISRSDPFPFDPSVAERGLRSHARLQNALADHLVGLGHEPESPAPTDPQFDLRWSSDEVVSVAEVKSLTDRNEERQLRLGLGQLLRYQHGLSREGVDVNAYLVCERKPRDSAWETLCREVGVELVWPQVLSERVS